METAKKIEDYVADLLYRYDLAPWKNENNQMRMDRIVAKCAEDLELKGVLGLLQNDNQIKYFVNQTILYTM